MNSQGKPYGQRIKEALRQGARAGLALKERRRAAGRKASDGGQYAAMPRVLHDQLVARYGSRYDEDATLMRDLRRRYPEMMAADGDVPGDSLDGSRNSYGKVSMRRRADGRWERPLPGGGWEVFQPPSKMKWDEGKAPAQI